MYLLATFRFLIRTANMFNFLMYQIKKLNIICFPKKVCKKRFGRELFHKLGAFRHLSLECCIFHNYLFSFSDQYSLGLLKAIGLLTSSTINSSLANSEVVIKSLRNKKNSFKILETNFLINPIFFSSGKIVIIHIMKACNKMHLAFI